MKQVKVWDLPVRLFHGALPLLIVALFLASGDEKRVFWHARLGLTLLVLVVARLAWGVFGSRHARFSDFVPSPAGLLRYAQSYWRGQPPAHLGHNPLGAVMVVAMLGVLLATTLTGVIVYAGPEWDGVLAPWISGGLAAGLKKLHEALAEALPFMVAAHVAGVLVSSVVERQNLPLAMVTGYKHSAPVKPAPKAEAWARSARPAATLLLFLAAALALATLQPGEAKAADPAAVLDGYASEARAGDPAFAPSATRGETFYRTEHMQDGKPVSCATCHTNDPRQSGRSPAGKIVEPLAPSANPKRFTDLSNIEKWFGRNCKQVMGRPCAAAEKADFVAYLLSAGGAR